MNTNFPLRCPECKSPAITQKDQFGSPEPVVAIVCEGCNFEWLEYYQFLHWRPMRRGEN